MSIISTETNLYEVISKALFIILSVVFAWKCTELSIMHKERTHGCPLGASRARWYFLLQIMCTLCSDWLFQSRWRSNRRDSSSRIHHMLGLCCISVTQRTFQMLSVFLLRHIQLIKQRIVYSPLWWYYRICSRVKHLQNMLNFNR